MILQSHMSTCRGAHFTSLGELEATVLNCLNLFKCYPSLSNHFPRQHKMLHSFNKLRVAFQFLTTWTSDKDVKLPLMDFQEWQGNSSSIEVFSCGYIFRRVKRKTKLMNLLITGHDCTFCFIQSSRHEGLYVGIPVPNHCLKVGSPVVLSC